MKIYTKSGDHGKTSLYGGRRVPKNNIRIKVYGAIDELNSLLGIVLSKSFSFSTGKYINQIQKDLFLIGSHLAGSDISIKELTRRVAEMENTIDDLDKKLPPLKNFLLPKGCEQSSYLFLARAIARRTERELVELSLTEKVDKNLHIYLNRLSDFLFVLARYINFEAGIPETIWKR